MLKRLLRDRKGISLTEVVIAMAVVLTVTGSAITLVISSIKADAGFRAKYQALTACENAADCLRFSKGNETLLKDALVKSGFKVENDECFFKILEHKVTVDDDEGKYFVKYTVERDGQIVSEETVYTYNTN